MDPVNQQKLTQLVSRLSQFRRLLKAKHVSFAGVLPSYLKQKKLEPLDLNPIDRTADVVAAAVKKIREDHFGNADHRVVLLGGAGRVGRQVFARLTEAGMAPRVVDPATQSSGQRLNDLSAGPMLLVDVSRRGILETYLDHLPKQVVLLNEVFPEPSERVRERLKSLAVTAYHLAGVSANVYPELPLSYRNAVPCCAMHADAGSSPVLKRLA